MNAVYAGEPELLMNHPASRAKEMDGYARHIREIGQGRPSAYA